MTMPLRLRIERRGNRITAFAGKAGEELVAIGTQTLTLTDPVYAGLGVSSHDVNVLETAVFSNVTLEQRPPAAPQQRYRSKVTIYDMATKAPTSYSSRCRADPWSARDALVPLYRDRVKLLPRSKGRRGRRPRTRRPPYNYGRLRSARLS